MRKILAPTDRVLSEIGRLTLARPLVSIFLLFFAIAITIISNEFVGPASAADSSAAEVVASLAAGSSAESSPPTSIQSTTTDRAPTLVQPSPPNSSPTINPENSSLEHSNLKHNNPQNQPNDVKQEAHLKTAEAAWQIIKIQSGDTLSKVFKKNALSAKDVAAVSHLSGAKALHHLKLGQEIRFYKDATGRLAQLAYAVDDKTTLNVTRSNSGYKAATQAVAISTVALSAENLVPAVTKAVTVNSAKSNADSKAVVANAAVTAATTVPATTPAETTKDTTPAVPSTKYISGRISHSLAVNARKAGLPAKQVNQLVAIFNQKNLTQKIRKGDEFSVLYENPKAAIVSTKKSKKPVKPGSNILAAQLITRDKTYELVRFVDPKGRVDYYTPDGKSMRDALSRQPLSFTHISSYFSNNRLDPVLHAHRPHLGVDFAAAMGTPVQAAGDGVLMEAGYNGGYGRMVVIQHDSQYTTRYAHLSKFASNIKVGQSVQRGQTIGYVGRTGFATGPHLHFEIRVNDVAMNPLTVALPSATIPAAYRTEFLAKSRGLLAQLNTNRRIWLAQNKPVNERQKG